MPIWQIGVAGMAIGLVMGVAAWYFTTPTSAGAQQQHQPRPHPEYQLFFVHPPGKNVDEEEVRRVEMEIQVRLRWLACVTGCGAAAAVGDARARLCNPTAWAIGR